MKVFLVYLFSFLLFQSIPAIGQSSNTSIKQFDYFQEATKRFESNIDSAMYYIKLGLPHYLEQEDWTNYVNCYNALTSCYWFKGEFIKSKKYAHLALTAAEKYLATNSMVLGSTLNNLAVFAKKKGDYHTANKYYIKSLELQNHAGQEADRLTIFNNLGGSYMAMGDFYESKRYFNEALRIAHEFLDPTDQKIAYTYTNLAKVYQIINDIDTAKILYHQINNLLDKDQNITLRAINKIIVSINLAKIAFDENAAIDFYNYTEEANYFSKLAHNRDNGEAYLLLGQWEFKQNKLKLAEQHFKKSISIYEKQFGNLGKHTDLGLANFHLANLYRSKGVLDKSLEAYQRALQQYAPTFTSTTIADNPKVEDLSIDKNIIKILKGKADTQLALYQKSQQVTQLKQSANTYQLAVDMINRIRQNYLDHNSKEILGENAISIFEGALSVFHQLYEKNKAPDLLNQLFQLAENSKSILLLESKNEEIAKGSGGIPDSLLLKEKELKIDISYYEQQLASNTTKDSKKRETLESGLFDLKNKHRALIKLFEAKFPAYHQLKYNTELVAISTLQKTLKKDAAIVEYFVGESHLFIFSITAQESQVLQLPKTNKFLSAVNQLHQLIMSPPNLDNAAKDFENFTTAAHSLYKTLIQPLQLNASIRSLIIIPDDILSYIPFEVLLKNEADQNNIDFGVEHLDYLLKDYGISYNYSATLLTQKTTQSEQAKNDFIGFAPSFESGSTASVSLRNCAEEEFHNLNCNQEEVIQINSLFAGRKVLGDRASKAQFLSEVPNHRIAHFATHSCLDDQNPMENKIILAGGYISNYDLYNMQLKTELAVLSACQTGTGKLMRGEGVMSLSRGFIHAGCPSLLMSLWSVEDCTTMDIMTGYYKNLKAGKTKDSSLQLTKLNYLSSSNKLFSHPFYWAPFIQFGNTDSMSFPNSSSLFWIAGLLFLIIVSTVIFLKRKWAATRL